MIVRTKIIYLSGEKTANILLRIMLLKVLFINKKNEDMKKMVLLAGILLIMNLAFADTDNIVKWNVECIETDNNTYEIKLHGKISENWYIYGMHLGDDGPLPLYIGFQEFPGLNVVKEFDENEKPKEIFDNIFNMNVSYYEKQAGFSSKIKTEGGGEYLILIIDGQACYTKDGSCIQVYDEIKINLN